MPRTKPPALPTLDDEIALLAAHRNRIAAWLEHRLAARNCEEAEALRCLATLSQVSGRVAALLLQRAATTGAQELEQFFEEVALRVEELADAGALAPPGDPPPQRNQAAEGAAGAERAEGAGGAAPAGPARPRRRPRRPPPA